MNSIEAFDEIKTDIRNVQFSKIYPLPGPVRWMDQLEQARESLESFRETIANRFGNDG